MGETSAAPAPHLRRVRTTKGSSRRVGVARAVRCAAARLVYVLRRQERDFEVAWAEALVPIGWGHVDATGKWFFHQAEADHLGCVAVYAADAPR